MLDAGLVVLAGLGLLAVLRVSRAAARVWRGRTVGLPLAVHTLGLKPAAADRAAPGTLFEGVIDGYRVTVERRPLVLRVVVNSGGRIPGTLRWGEGSREPGVVPGAPRAHAGRLARFLARMGSPWPRASPVARFFGPKERAKIVLGLKNLKVQISEGELHREIDASVSGVGLIRRIRNTVKVTDMLARGILPACERALASDDPSARLEAACILGERGLPALRALAAEDRAPASVVLKALRHLDAAGDREALTAALMHAVEGRKDAVRLFAIETLGEMGHRPAVQPLVALLGEDGDTATAAARSLGAIGDPRAEAGLIAALRSDDEQVRQAAAEALGKAGTVASVEPLRALIKRVWLPAGLGSLAHEAVRRIQARAPGADTGQLSLADAGSARGALSVAPVSGAADGALSLPEAGAGEQLAVHSEADLESAAERSPAAAKRPRDRQGG